MKREPWRTSDVAIVREHYPKGGADAVWEALPADRKRAPASINIYARRTLGLTYSGPRKGRVPRESTPEIDQALRDGMPLSEVSVKFGRSRSWIVGQIARLGLKYDGDTRRLWTPAEDAILEDTQGRPASAVVRALKAAGFERTVDAVKDRRGAIKIGNRQEFPGYLSQTELARMLGYCRQEIVARWTMLRDDPLRERVTGQVRRIKESDFREWVIRNPTRIDLRKMPPASMPWFIELLSGSAPVDIGTLRA